jgi:hypothetical protein
LRERQQRLVFFFTDLTLTNVVGLLKLVLDIAHSLLTQLLFVKSSLFEKVVVFEGTIITNISSATRKTHAEIALAVLSAKPALLAHTVFLLNSHVNIIVGLVVEFLNLVFYISC